MEIKKLIKKTALIILILVFLIPLSSTSYALDSSESKSETIVETKNDASENLNILSDSVILIDSKTGTTLYSKNADQKMYPASTTKIMTAILVLENGRLTDTTTVSQTAISSIPSGYSTAYLSEGEKLSIADLLKALLIHSANDSANVLAEYVSGSIEDFVNLMNAKAKELGCVNTHFTNTNGIHDENHYSTANDLAIIAKYCMQNSSFRTIVSMSSCTIPATNKSEERNFVNTNDLILDSSEYYRKDCIGIKTGYTSQAKNCLISACSDGNIELISVILGSNSLSDRYADANTLFDYGYEIHDSIAQIEADTDTKIENEDSSVDQNFLNNDITTSPLSTKDLFSQSFFEYLVQSDILIIILRVLLILIILAILAIFLTKKLREEKVEKQL